MLCEEERNAPESQNSIPSKSRFSFGLAKAAGTAAAPTQGVSGVFVLISRWARSSQGSNGTGFFFSFPVFQDVKESHPFLQPLLACWAQIPAPRAHEREQIPLQQIPCQQQLLLGTAFGDRFIPCSQPPAWPWSRGVPTTAG